MNGCRLRLILLFASAGCVYAHAAERNPATGPPIT